jgi:hypothetical protein
MGRTTARPTGELLLYLADTWVYADGDRRNTFYHVLTWLAHFPPRSPRAATLLSNIGRFPPHVHHVLIAQPLQHLDCHQASFQTQLFLLRVDVSGRGCEVARRRIFCDEEDDVLDGESIAVLSCQSP